MTANKILCGTDDQSQTAQRIFSGNQSLFDGIKLELWKQLQLELSKSSSLSNEEFLKTMELYQIPIVFHVIYKEDIENIDTAVILQQLNSLNNDFKNGNIGEVVFDGFPREKGLAMDAKIEFRMANIDPDGHATDGITRTHTAIESFECPEGSSSDVPLDDQPMKSTYLGGKDAWDTRRYLNVWICNLPGASGYAQYPDSPGTMTDDQFRTDGVVIHYKCFGSSATTEPTRNKGRTLTHEVGHWLGLYHLWGPGGDGTGCGMAGDGISDTEPQDGPQFGRPSTGGGYSSAEQCPGCDPPLVLNQMDQWDDESCLMFTREQAASMRHWLVNLRGSVIITSP